MRTEAEVKGEEALAFLPMPQRDNKPRSNGLVVVVDGMDAGFLSFREIEDLGDFSAQYIDYFKLGWLLPRLVPQAALERKISCLQRIGIKVLAGGMALEYALLHGQVSRYLDSCRDIGFDAVEVSSSAAFVSLKRQKELAAEITNRGLEVFVELGRKGSAYDPTAGDVQAHLDAFEGLHISKMVFESERIASLEERGELEGFLEQLSRADPSKIILELPYGISFPRLLPTLSKIFGVLGPDANVANVDVRHVLALETVRTGTCFGDLFGLVPIG